MPNYTYFKLTFEGEVPSESIAAALDDAAASNWDHPSLALDTDPITGEVWERPVRPASDAARVAFAAGEWRARSYGENSHGREVLELAPPDSFTPGQPAPSHYAYSPFDLAGLSIFDLSRWRGEKSKGALTMSMDQYEKKQYTLRDALPWQLEKYGDPLVAGDGTRLVRFVVWRDLCEAFQRVRVALLAAGAYDLGLKVESDTHGFEDGTLDLSRMDPYARPLEMAWRMIPEAEQIFGKGLLEEWLVGGRRRILGDHEREQIDAARDRLYAEASAWAGRPLTPPQWGG